MTTYRRPQRVLMPHPIGHTLRTLARWAVATSLGASGACAARHEDGSMGQTVPTVAGSRAAAGGGPAAASDAGSKPAPSPPMDAMVGTSTPSPSQRPPTQPPQPPQPMVADDAGAPPPAPVWQAITCSGNSPNLFAEKVKLAREVDYVALYYSQPGGFGAMDQSPYVALISEQGSVCATSSNRAACDVQAAMFRQPSVKCREQRMCGPTAGFTYKDEVQLFEKPDAGAFLQLLGPIDSPAKAVIAAFWDGLWIACPRTVVRGSGSMTLRGTEVSQRDGAWVVRTEWETCGPMSRDTLTLDEDGEVLAKSHEDLGQSGCVAGRRPAGLRVGVPKAGPSALSAYLAGTARLEAASVCAFERLAEELRVLGAPAPLVRAARDAALDEVRHARLMTQLARNYGAEPSEPCIDAMPHRSPFAIALENAVEGCVRETFAAVLAHYQAALAADPAIAWAMMRIAEDETRHAELAWQVAAWLEPKLSSQQQAELRAAQAVALDELALEAALPGMSPAEYAALGWPPSPLRARLLESMVEQLGLQAVA